MSDEALTIPNMARHRAVLELGTEPGPGDQSVWFGQRDADNEGEWEMETYVLSAEQFEELGEPRFITIAVWPGDRQDLMESEDFPE